MNGNMMDFHGKPKSLEDQWKEAAPGIFGASKDKETPSDIHEMTDLAVGRTPAVPCGHDPLMAYRQPGDEPQKFDDGKPALALVHQYLGDSLAEMAHVLSYGANKYPSVDNFQGHGPKIPLKYLSAALRHIQARLDGEMVDEESLRPHLAHALVSIGFVVWWDSQGGK